MTRYIYKHGKGWRTIYIVKGSVYSGKGCHMKAFSHWGSLNPKKTISSAKAHTLFSKGTP